MHGEEVQVGTDPGCRFSTSEDTIKDSTPAATMVTFRMD